MRQRWLFDGNFTIVHCVSLLLLFGVQNLYPQIIVLTVSTTQSRSEGCTSYGRLFSVIFLIRRISYTATFLIRSVYYNAGSFALPAFFRFMCYPTYCTCFRKTSLNPTFT